MCSPATGRRTPSLRWNVRSDPSAGHVCERASRHSARSSHRHSTFYSPVSAYLSADRPASPGGGRPGRLGCASWPASRDNRAGRRRARRGALTVRQSSRALPPPDFDTVCEICRYRHLSERARLCSVLSPPFCNRLHLSQHRDCPPKAVLTGRPGVAEGATDTTFWTDHQIGARANGLPAGRLGVGSAPLPVAKFLRELP